MTATSDSGSYVPPQVRVVTAHEDLGEDTYHEWITFHDRVKADRLGRPHPRILSAEWTKWICNNPDCAAWCLVPDDGIRFLIGLSEAAQT